MSLVLHLLEEPVCAALLAAARGDPSMGEPSLSRVSSRIMRCLPQAWPRLMMMVVMMRRRVNPTILLRSAISDLFGDPV